MSHSNPLVRTGDVLIQKFARKYACVVCGYQATVGYHLIDEDNMFFRHDRRNILPLCDAHCYGIVLSPNGTPKNFNYWMGYWHLDRIIWKITNQHKRHKAPSDAEIKANNKFLRAFLKAGKPYVWSAE